MITPRRGLTAKFPSEYTCFSNIKQRCYNKNRSDYARYGGKGIRVCRRWFHSFHNFISDMGAKPSKKHSIDRIDSNGHYCPENCRWATPEQQQRNKNNNRYLTIHGQTHCVAKWAELSGLTLDQVLDRLKLGWSPEEAISISIGEFPKVKRFTYNGVTKWLSQWARENGISYALLHFRINKKGLSIEEALFTPVKSPRECGIIGGNTKKRSKKKPQA